MGDIMAIYTYLRTSTKKQTTERQEYIFQQQGIKSDRDFKDKITGTKSDRPALNELKLTVKEGGYSLFCFNIKNGKEFKRLY